MIKNESRSSNLELNRCSSRILIKDWMESRLHECDWWNQLWYREAVSEFVLFVQSVIVKPAVFCYCEVNQFVLFSTCNCVEELKIKFWTSFLCKFNWCISSSSWCGSTAFEFWNLVICQLAEAIYFASSILVQLFNCCLINYCVNSLNENWNRETTWRWTS